MRRPLVPVILLLCACGDDGPAGAPDAGAPDAAGAADARPAGDLRAQLEEIPGLSVVPGITDVAGYQLFHLVYEQPVDHAAPDGDTFPQRLTLLHRAADAPMVLHTEGYYVSTDDDRTEPARLLGANQLAVEHRFFEPSRPEPAAWDKLTIEQAAADHHRVVQAFRPLYPGRWLSTGASKGGMTAVYHRRFYPDDVDGTIAYVAPHSLGAPDPRYPAFLDLVGDAACRADLAALQRTALERRAAMLAAMGSWAADKGETFDILGEDMALEHVVLELAFAFWQYGTASWCAYIPEPTATDAQIFSFLDQAVGFWLFADDGVIAYQPYYYQASIQLGYPAYAESHLAGLLAHPGTYAPQPYSPAGVPLVHDAAAMQDISAWMTAEGSQLLFIYGENDPWSAGAFDPGAAVDSYVFTVPAGNHGASIAQLPAAEQQQAQAAVRRWAGVSSLRSAVAEEAPAPVRRRAPF